MSDFELFAITIVFSWALGFAIYHYHRQWQRNNRKKIDQAYEITLASHCIADVQIVQDRTTLGTKREGKKPFEVYRILLAPPNDWYSYIHIEDSEPLLTPISEARAKAAMIN